MRILLDLFVASVVVLLAAAFAVMVGAWLLLPALVLAVVAWMIRGFHPPPRTH